MSKFSLMLLSCCAVAACSAAPAQKAKNPIKEAISLSKGSAECLQDVRDKALKYEKSSNCLALQTLVRAYRKAGGDLPSEPLQSAIIAQQARTDAWSALAISVSGDPTISIW